MFIDLVKLHIKSGRGGDGMSAFRREKYVPKGGPSGGDGGEGGNVIFEGDEGLSTLLEFRYNTNRAAEDGEAGKNKKMHGKNGADLVLKVPVGTSIFNEKNGKVLADITEHKQRVTVLKGGRGGRGNVKFTSSKNTAPDIAEKGEPALELDIRLELKLIADIGLIGMPSVGKSTIISAISAAKPKIAAYHFTTITPNLGMVSTNDQRSFVVADMPGLIEGAAQGEGLGQDFLRHIERTRLLLHVIDMSAFEGRDPYQDYVTIQNELKQYKHKLDDRPQIIVANKMDMPNAKANLEAFQEAYSGSAEIIPISAYTNDNLDTLIHKTADLLDAIKKESLYQSEDFDEPVVYEFTAEKAPFTIKKGDDGIYDIEGEGLRRIFEMTDFDKEQSVRRFARQLRGIGVDQALRDKGVKHGETVRIFDVSFEFID